MIGFRQLLDAAAAAIDYGIGKISVCSKCFNDFGLVHTCEVHGRPFRGACPKCRAFGGAGLTVRQAHEVCYNYVNHGTYFHGAGGFAPYLKLADPAVADDVKLRPETRTDWEILSSITGSGIRHYGPPLWRLGYTDHLGPQEGEDGSEFELSRAGAQRVLDGCPERKITNGAKLYRLRIGLDRDKIGSDTQYDSPPAGIKLQHDRFDSENISIFYAGTSVDVCLHEVRLSTRDTLTLATCTPLQELRLLDITGEEGARSSTPFGDPLHLFNGLVFSTDRASECRMIAQIIHERRYDGFMYKSFYDPVMFGSGRNIALFGWPIREGKLRVQSINNVFVRKITPEFQLGPIVEEQPRDANSPQP
jgi:hypothetical protein